MKEIITKEQYELALSRVEELLPLVGDVAPEDDPKARELAAMSEIIIAYEETQH